MKVSDRSAGACGILAPVVAFAAIASSILMHPWFRWADNALSDLGALKTPYNFVFNSGLIAAGLLFLIFLSGFQRQINRWLGRVGVIFWYASAISLVMIGVFPSGTSPHQTVSEAFYGLGLLAFITLGIDQLREREGRVWGALIMSVMVVALVSVSLLTTIPYKLGAAIPELIGAVAFSEFSIIFGAKLLKLF
jgi:hypothetical membrane protein